MTGPESIEQPQDLGNEPFRGMRSLPGRDRKKADSWEDEGFKKYLRLRKITSSPPSGSEKSKDKDKSEEEPVRKTDEDEDGIPEEKEREIQPRHKTREKPKKLALPGPGGTTVTEPTGDCILTELPTDMRGIVTVMYLIEFVKKRVGSDSIQGQLYHYHMLGWLSEEVLEKLMKYSKMIMGDLGYFECDLDDDVPTTSTLHHSKVLEIIFMIKNGVDIGAVREFESPKLLKLFEDFTGRGAW